jgi:hypothetical protein
MDIVRYLNECARRYLDLAREAPSEQLRTSYEALAQDFARRAKEAEYNAVRRTYST